MKFSNQNKIRKITIFESIKKINNQISFFSQIMRGTKNVMMQNCLPRKNL